MNYIIYIKQHLVGLVWQLKYLKIFNLVLRKSSKLLISFKHKVSFRIYKIILERKLSMFFEKEPIYK